MTLNITITATGIDATIKALTTVAKQLGDHRDFLKDEVVPELKREFRSVFRSSGYGRWRRLSPVTIQEKLEHGYPTSPLIRTGYYRRASEKLTGLKIRRNVLEIDSPVRYAGYQEYGTRRIPARPVFGSVAREMERRLPKMYQIWARRRLLRELS